MNKLEQKSQETGNQKNHFLPIQPGSVIDILIIFGQSGRQAPGSVLILLDLEWSAT